jgi:uncharacterized protein (TIGR03435 family)
VARFDSLRHLGQGGNSCNGESAQADASKFAGRALPTCNPSRHQLPVYALTIGKSGLKLREVKEGEPKPPPPRAEPGALMVEYTVLKMQEFADNLSRIGEIGRPVLNRTGLQGTYAFDLQLFEGQDFMGMVQERCGLKFESQRASIDILVIDRVERPNGN